MTDFNVTELQPAPFAYIKRSAAIPDMSRVMGEGFATLGGLFAQGGAAPAGAPLAHYLDFTNNSTTFEMGFPIRPEDAPGLQAAGLGIGETPRGTVMQAVHIGPYESMVATYAKMQDAMKRQGLTGAKDMWERYFSPPETPPAEVRTEVIWPVHKAP